MPEYQGDKTKTALGESNASRNQNKKRSLTEKLRDKRDELTGRMEVAREVNKLIADFNVVVRGLEKQLKAVKEEYARGGGRSLDLLFKAPHNVSAVKNEPNTEVKKLIELKVDKYIHKFDPLSLSELGSQVGKATELKDNFNSQLSAIYNKIEKDFEEIKQRRQL